MRVIIFANGLFPDPAAHRRLFRPGDLVIAEGVQKVREGSPVEILETRRADRGVNEGAAAGAGSAGSAFGE